MKTTICSTRDKSSDFWSFFHITEKERFLEEEDRFLKDGVNQITFVGLETGSFQSEIELGIRLDQQQRLKEAMLAVKRRWLIGPPYGVNPLALDIVRSFISTLIPPPEQQRIEELMTKLTDIEKPNYARQVLMEKTDNSMLQQALLTYLRAGKLVFKFQPHSQHPKLGFFSSNKLSISLKLRCGGWDPHPTLPVKICLGYAWREFETRLGCKQILVKGRRRRQRG